MLKKLTAGLLSSLMLISVLGLAGCASSGGQSDFEKELEAYEKQKQMEMKK